MLRRAIIHANRESKWASGANKFLRGDMRRQDGERCESALGFHLLLDMRCRHKNLAHSSEAGLLLGAFVFPWCPSNPGLTPCGSGLGGVFVIGIGLSPGAIFAN